MINIFDRLKLELEGQHFIISAKHLPQEYIDKLPLEKKNTILQKLHPSPAAGDNVVLAEEV